MSSKTIKEISVKRRITKNTKEINVLIDGEVMTIEFEADKFADGFSHDDVINYYSSNGIEVVDWD